MTMKLDTVAMYEFKNAVKRLCSKFKNIKRIRNTKRNGTDEQIATQIEKETALEVRNIRAIITDARMSKAELEIFCRNEMPIHFMQMLRRLDAKLDELDKDTFDYNEARHYFEAIDEFFEMFFDGIEMEYDFASFLVSNALPSSPLNAIGHLIDTTRDKAINLIANVNARQGHVIANLELQNTVTHGYEIPEHLEGNFTYDRKAIGALVGGNITHDAFDVGVLAIDFSSKRKTDTTTAATAPELSKLMQLTKYIRQDGGQLLFVIPKTRITSNIASFLLRNYHDIEVLASEDGVWRVVSALRHKKDTMEPEKDVVAFRQEAFSDNIKTLAQAGTKVLPPTAMEIENFRGSTISKRDAAEFIQSDKSAYALMEADQNDDGVVQETTPLLPFSTGQVGMVLTGGYLNGLVEEGNGYNHLVKGRVVRRESTVTTVKEDGAEMHQTTSSSAVQIHLIMPDGSNKQFI